MSEFKRLADLLLTNDLDTALRLVDKQYQARIGLLEALIVTLVPAGYGGIEATGTTVGNSLGAGFDTLDYIYDQNKFADPRGVTQDFANGEHYMKHRPAQLQRACCSPDDRNAWQPLHNLHILSSFHAKGAILPFLPFC